MKTKIHLQLHKIICSHNALNYFQGIEVRDLIIDLLSKGAEVDLSLVEINIWSSAFFKKIIDGIYLNFENAKYIFKISDIKDELLSENIKRFINIASDKELYKKLNEASLSVIYENED